MGWLGKSYDARMFENFPLYQECHFHRELYLAIIGNTSIPPLMLRSSGYPLEEFVMKAYVTFGDLNPQGKMLH